MTDEMPPTNSQDIVLGITIPRRFSVTAVGTFILLLASAVAFSATIDGRVRELERQADEDQDSLQRIERTLCMMCVQELGAGSCNGICRTGSVDK